MPVKSALRRASRLPFLGLRKALLSMTDWLFLSRFRGRPTEVVAYRGYGSTEAVWVRGRVLESGGRTPMHEHDPWWLNLVHSYRRFRARALADALVRLEIGEAVLERRTDERGFFTAVLPCGPLAPSESGWHEVHITLIEPLTADQPPVTAVARVMVPPERASLGVVSDIDDTVLRTWAFDKVRMTRLMLLHNAHTRLPFPGVATFYRALHDGPDGRGRNPVVYVSSSAWNLYDLLRDFLELNELPAGPLLLRDLLFTRASLIGGSRHDHKLDRIREVFDTWPGLPFVLVGDTGQRDAWLYRQVVQEHPGRVAAVYLRDVTPSESQREEIRAIADACTAEGVPFLLVEDSLEAARHAARQGFIDPARLPGIGDDVAFDEGLAQSSTSMTR